MSDPPRPLPLIAVAVIAVVAVAVAALVLLAEPEPATHESNAPPGFVYRDGNRLFLDGEPYRFVGLNMYWANSRRPVGCGPPVPAERLHRTLDRIRGSANAVRAYFFQSHATLNGVRDWTVFDQTLDAISARGLKVVVTLANQHGACGDPPGGEKGIDWYRTGYASEVPPGFPQTYRDYVRDIVRRYADRPEILAWQLTNEAAVLTPGVGCPDEQEAARVLRAWADDVAGLIRSIDPHHLISLGTGLQGACGTAVTSDPSNNSYRYLHSGPNIDLCEYHDYNAPASPLFVLQRWEMDTCAAVGKAFFVGEVGIDRTNPSRPALLEAKLDAQFNYPTEPLQGALVWMLGNVGAGPCDQYCVEVGDPVLDVLARYR